jgi:hypothetical protein
MHEAALAQAALPAPTVILGLLMRPYSLGHELHLIREQNPIITSLAMDQTTLKNLRQAALICCQSWSECRRMHADPFLKLKIRFWKLRTRNISRPLGFAAGVVKFIDYRNTGVLDFPPRKDVRKPGSTPTRKPGTPFILSLQQFVMLHLGKTEAEAWDYPLGLAKMRWAAYYENEGSYEVYNEHDAEFERFVEEQDAQWEAAAKKKEGKHA